MGYVQRPQIDSLAVLHLDNDSYSMPTQITITRIDHDKEVQLDEHTSGFWAAFSCRVTGGTAIIVSDKKKFLEGQQIYVETNFDRLSGWAVCEESVPQIIALPHAGDYTVVGRVVTRFESGLISVEVSDFSFNIYAGRDTAPQPGQWVSFNLHQLSLEPYD